jgi:hypothetical protein
LTVGTCCKDRQQDADEKSFFDDTKFVVDLLKSAFRKLEDVGKALNAKVPH